MANRYFKQFSYSFEKQPVRLMGSIEQTDAGAFASRVLQGITITANRMGAAGNSITIAFTAGGTAGAEVVSVSGNAISVQVEAGVSTVTQTRTAINASVPAAALVTASGTNASTISAASALPLQNGDDTDFDKIGLDGLEVFQSGTGVYEIQLSDAYKELLGASFSLQRAAAVDLGAQLQSADVSGDKLIEFRMQAGSTPTNMANDDILYIVLELRNS